MPWPTGCGFNQDSPCFFGGQAYLKWAYQGQNQAQAEAQQPYYFYICGRNPTTSQATAEVNAVMGTPYWFSEKLAWHETGVSQFCELPSRAAVGYCAAGNHTEGWPIFGAPAGVWHRPARSYTEE